MKKRAMKSAIIAIEVIALVIAISAGVLMYLYWRLGQGPISFGLLKPGIETAIEQRLPVGFNADISSITIARGQNAGEYQLNLSEIEILDADEHLVTSAPNVLFSFGIGDILSGEIGPRSIIADGAELRIIRRRDQSVEIPVIRSATQQQRKTPLASFLDGGYIKSAFQSANITNAKITFLDEASGRSWVAPGAEVIMSRNSDGLTASANGAITTGSGSAGISAKASYKERTRVVDVIVDGDNFPIGDILSTFYSADGAVLEAPVSGSANITFTSAGEVISSSFKANIDEGALTIGAKRRDISNLNWETEFDPVANLFTINEFAFDLEGGRGLVTGEIGISFGEDIRKPERVSFDLRAGEIVIDEPALLPVPLPVTDLLLQGQYVVPERRLTMRTVDADFAGLSAVGDLTFVMAQASEGTPTPSPGVIANVDFEGSLDPERLLMVWPKTLALGARDWIEARLRTATIDNLNFVMDMAPGAIAEDGAVPDDAMSLTFDARNVSASYIPGMTPLRDGAGKGTLRGNSFHLDVSKAQINDVAITTGEVSFPTFMPKWEPTYYRFTAKGDTKSILAIVDEKPLSFLSKVNLSPEQFSGDATARIEIMRPNKRNVRNDEYGYAGTAEFEDVTVEDLVGDVEFVDATGTVDLKTRSLKVTAKAALTDDAPINLVWQQNFYREDGPSNIGISGVFDASTGDLFGISSRQFVLGPVAFDANATGELGNFQSLNVKTDFTQAALSVDVIGWRKPAGVKASGDVIMHFEDDAVIIDTLAMTGGGVDISGAMAFEDSGALKSLALPLFYLEDAADLIITAERDATGMLGFTAVGEFLNAGPLLEEFLNGSQASAGVADEAENDTAPDSGIAWGRGIALSARIDRIAVRNGIEYRNAALDLSRDQSELKALDFSAFDAGNKPLTVSLELTGSEDGPDYAIEARSSALGTMMAGVFGIQSVEGGEGTVRIIPHTDGQSGFSGQLEARDIQVVNAPLLARIFSAGSFNGMSNLLSGDGIGFDYAHGGFDFTQGQLSLTDMRATGSSVGITAEGALGFGEGANSNLTGAVAPLYGLNSILGNAPLIGDILVGTKGEGLVAFTYRINGDITNPSVTVNPLSVLAPGILRELMEPEQPATVAAPVEEQPSTENAEPVQ